MKDKENMKYDSEYFEDILTEIKKIRCSEKSRFRKLQDAIATACDYEENEKINGFVFMHCESKLGEPLHLRRFLNMLLMRAEQKAKLKTTMKVNEIDQMLTYFMDSNLCEQDIYDYSSFSGEYGMKDKDGNPQSVWLPEELKGVKTEHVVLKVIDMWRVMETFCGLDSRYKRAFALLSEVESEMVEGFKSEKLPLWINPDYKDGGVAMFTFSHFELDTDEPNDEFRTLYVVYEYDTTAS